MSHLNNVVDNQSIAMDLPDPQQYAAAFATALRDQLTKQVAPPAVCPAEPAPLNLNTDVCVFVGGRFLPRGSAPDFPRRRVLAKQESSLQTSLCSNHYVNVCQSFDLEFDNYGNFLFLGNPKYGGANTLCQHAVYFMRSTECIAAPTTDILALTLATLMQQVGRIPTLRQNIICDDWAKVKCTAGHTDKCPEPPPHTHTRCPGRGTCNNVIHGSSFPADSKARMFAGHPDDLSAEQRDGAVELCNFLESHFRSVLDPFYRALHVQQEVMRRAAPVPAPESAPATDAAQASTAPTDWAAVETVREEALANVSAYELANRLLREELASLMATHAAVREQLLGVTDERNVLVRKTAEYEGELLVARRLQERPPLPPPCKVCSEELPRLRALVGGAEHTQLERLKATNEVMRKRCDVSQQEARELVNELQESAARAQAAQSADAAAISRLKNELTISHDTIRAVREKLRDARSAADHAAQALAAAKPADTSREGIIASLYAQIDELKTACSRADERAAKAVAREKAAQTRVAEIAAVVAAAVGSRSEPKPESEPEPEDDDDHETAVLIANARKNGYAPYPSKRG
jgi:hypothetical protein